MEDIKEKYIGFVEKMLNFFGPKKYEKYIEIARNPKQEIKKLELLGSMLITLFILNFILEVIPGLTAIGIIYLSDYFGTQSISIMEIGIAGITTLFSGIILILVLGFYSILEFIFAKILGGVGTFNEHLNISFNSYLIVYILSIPLLIISAVIGIIQSIPILNIILCILFLPLFIVGIIQLIIGIYGLYIKFIMVKELHKFDDLKALIVMFGPYLSLLLLTIIVVVVIMALGISLAAYGITGLN